MTLKELLTVLQSLQIKQGKGGKQYKDISYVFNLEATTHNGNEASKLLRQLKGISND